MNKLTNWGRWCAAVYFGLEGLIFLAAIETVVVYAAVESHERMLYQAMMAPIISFPLLACSWGIMRLRRWAYGLGVILSLFEGIAGIIAIRFLKSGISFVGIGGFSIYFDPVSVSWFLSAYVVLLWLLLPSVRTQFLSKGLAA